MDVSSTGGHDMTSENMEAMPQKEMPTAQTAPPLEAEEAPESEDATLTTATEEGQEQRGGRLPPNAREGKANQLLRDGARWPPAVALLNLTGTGLGYLYIKRWPRWLIHLVLTAGLIATASITNGASRPGLWTAVLGAWVVWMAFDGWRLARATPLGGIAHRWLPAGVAVLILVLEAAGLWGYRALGQRTFAEGMAAYWDADCRTAMQHFDRVTTLYELTLSPNVAAADAGIVECSLLVFAENARGQGEYAEAVDGYATYLDLYPESVLIIFVRDTLAATYGEWATHFRKTQDYQVAIEKYQVVLSDYPETPDGKQAAALAAETYAEWAVQLREGGKYAETVEKHRIVLSEYPDTPAGGRAAVLAAETYDEWAAHLREDGKCEEAIGKYDIVLGEYADTPAAKGARAAAAETYAEWAAQLRRDGEYEEAIEKYQLISGEYSGTPTAAEAREPAAGTYAEWAAQLRESGDYGAAIEKYDIVVGEYPDTPAAAEVKEQEAVAGTYAEWAAQLRETGLYATAITKYQAILSEHPDTQPAKTAQAAIGQTYNDWGSQLHSQRKYIEAMDRFTLAKEATDDPDVVAAAEEGYDEALWGLSQDRTGEGKKVMEQALPGVCDGEPADSPAVGLAEDEPGKALFDGSEFKLPSDLKATSPGHFRYAVCLETGTSVVQRCPYTGGHTLVRQRRWWRVRVRDTRTARVVANRTFNGPSPAACPFSRSFWATVDYSTGSPPSADQVIGWLQGVVR
jgi:tetratricopeptide (TPR) repeat protein